MVHLERDASRELGYTGRVGILVREEDIAGGVGYIYLVDVLVKEVSSTYSVTQGQSIPHKHQS